MTNSGQFKKGRPENSAWYGKKRPEIAGAKNPNWGIVPTYNSVHIWLRQNYKKEKCEHCGTTKRLHWALRKGANYLVRNRENYLILCVKCHAVYDKKGVKNPKISESNRRRVGMKYKK